MRGELISIHANDPTYLVRPLEKPPTIESIQQLVGGNFERVAGFDTIYYKQAVHPCVALANEDGSGTYNVNANMLWQSALARKGHKATFSNPLHGDVVVILGDKELLDSL